MPHCPSQSAARLTTLAAMLPCALVCVVTASPGRPVANRSRVTRAPPALPPVVQLPPFEIAPGVKMPAVNCGHPDDTANTNCTHGRGPGCAKAAAQMTSEWLAIGGQGIDTAADYNNQKQVGQAIMAALRNGTINRKSIFVTTKIDPGGRSGTGRCTRAAALAAVKEDAQELAMGKLDLVLQHFPCASDAENQDVWRGLVEAQALGYTRAVGVSHFNQSQLEAILSINRGAPAVNQCEMYVGKHDDATIKFCQAHNITYESYGALRSVDFTNSHLVAIAKAHAVSVAQVALRWVTQYGCPVAVSPGLKHEYQVEDLGLGAFTLTKQEMATLSAI